MDAVRFKQEYLSLSSRLYRVAYYILESESEAEDALQELYLKLWQIRGRLDFIQTPEAYSIRLLKNICIDRIRSSKKTVVTDKIPETGTEMLQDERIDSSDRLQKVLAAVKSLPERQRQVLTLRLIEGRSDEEIMKITGLGYLTIRVVLSRAKQSLKNKL